MMTLSRNPPLVVKPGLYVDTTPISIDKRAMVVEKPHRYSRRSTAFLLLQPYHCKRRWS